MRYDPQIDLENKNRTHTRIFDSVPDGSEVLDVGCARGELGSLLREKKSCRVTGIELDPGFAAEARGRLDRVLVGPAESGTLWDELGDADFDVIVCADVLEHLPSPESVLNLAAARLRPGGRLIVSLPNIATWRLRKQLLLGHFEYTDEGIMDRTHLRFYTRDSGLRLIESCGFRVTGIDFVVGPRVGRYLSRLGALGRFLPQGLAGTQFIYTAEVSQVVR